MKGPLVVILLMVSAVVGLMVMKRQHDPVAAPAVDERVVGEAASVDPPLTVPVIEEPGSVVDEQAPAAAQETPPVAAGEEPVAEAEEAAIVEPAVVEPEERTPDEVRVLVGHDQVDKEVLDGDLESTVLSGEWANYESLLERSLLGAIDGLPRGSDLDPHEGVWAVEPFYTSLLRWHVLQVLPPQEWHAASKEPASAALARWLFGNQEAMEEVLMTMTGEDNASKVLKTLVMLWGSHGEEEKELAPKYFNLALACAVVFDREIALKNAGGQNGYTVDAQGRYQWYVEKNQKGWLEVSIDRSPARDLVFVVCAPVSEDELDWAVRKFRSTRRDGWGKTYGAVKYLMERAVEGLNPYQEYTLEEILEEGGICGDQTYFCVNTARAAGIPAIGLSGVTSSGGHAWAAVKVDKDEWSTQIGRIGGVSAGSGEDPQSGGRITEQDIWMWSSREHQQQDRVLKVHRHLWLADLLRPHGHDELVASAVGVAFRVGKAFPKVWESQYRIMLKDEKLQADPAASAAVAVWDDFAKSLKHQFQDNPRMGGLATEVEDKHVFPHQNIADIRRSLMRDRRRHERNAGEQSDLVVSTLKREARFLLEKDPDNARREISQLYDKALKDYGSSLTGFRTMAEDYFKLVGGHDDMGRKVVRDIELAYQRVVGSGSTDFFRAKAEAEIQRRISEMYRQVGDEKRAELLDNRQKRQTEKAKRGAL